MMDELAERLQHEGRRPHIVPLGASTPVGAIGFARRIAELASDGMRPDVFVHATSSGGTQAGMIAGCALFGLRARILGVSADERSADLAATVSSILSGLTDRLGAKPETLGADRPVEIDDTQVGEGYGVPTPASTEALELVARREGVLLDPVYTAKAMAGLIDRIRRGEFSYDQSILFWHTGGQIANFT